MTADELWYEMVVKDVYLDFQKDSSLRQYVFNTIETSHVSSSFLNLINTMVWQSEPDVRLTIRGYTRMDFSLLLNHYIRLLKLTLDHPHNPIHRFLREHELPTRIREYVREAPVMVGDVHFDYKGPIEIQEVIEDNQKELFDALQSENRNDMLFSTIMNAYLLEDRIRYCRKQCRYIYNYVYEFKCRMEGKTPKKLSHKKLGYKLLKFVIKLKMEAAEEYYVAHPIKRRNVKRGCDPEAIH